MSRFLSIKFKMLSGFLGVSILVVLVGLTGIVVSRKVDKSQQFAGKIDHLVITQMLQQIDLARMMGTKQLTSLRSLRSFETAFKETKDKLCNHHPTNQSI